MRRDVSQRLNGHILTTCQPREEIPRLIPTCLPTGMHNAQLSIMYLNCCVLICEYTASVLPTSCARRRDLLRRMRAARTTRSRHCIMTSTRQDKYLRCNRGDPRFCFTEPQNLPIRIAYIVVRISSTSFRGSAKPMASTPSAHLQLCNHDISYA